MKKQKKYMSFIETLLLIKNFWGFYSDSNLLIRIIKSTCNYFLFFFNAYFKKDSFFLELQKKISIQEKDLNFDNIRENIYKKLETQIESGKAFDNDYIFNTYSKINIEINFIEEDKNNNIYLLIIKISSLFNLKDKRIEETRNLKQNIESIINQNYNIINNKNQLTIEIQKNGKEKKKNTEYFSDKFNLSIITKNDKIFIKNYNEELYKEIIIYLVTYLYKD